MFERPCLHCIGKVRLSSCISKIVDKGVVLVSKTHSAERVFLDMGYAYLHTDIPGIHSSPTPLKDGSRWSVRDFLKGYERPNQWAVPSWSL